MSNSPSPHPARLLVDPPAPGDWNMAVDEMLLDRAADNAVDHGICLRFYEWSEATVSLGYFQSYAERESHTASRTCPLVRRLSGGGAIVHDRELTYSLIVPAAHPLARRAPQLYARVHTTLIATLHALGFTASLHGANDAAEPFLCFLRRTEADVVVGGAKIAGSAQRRRRGVILQHGSIVLDTSPAAPELPGIAALTGHRLSADELRHAWLPQLACGLGIECQPSPLAAAERAQAENYRRQRFAADAWNRRK